MHTSLVIICLSSVSAKERSVRKRSSSPASGFSAPTCSPFRKAARANHL